MWIIPKNHSLHSIFAQDLVASKEELKEHAFDLIGPRRNQSLMWRSKPSSLKIWLSRWNKVWWMQRLYGRILKPSHGQNFTEKYTSSLGDIHASPFLLQAKWGGADDPRHLWPFIKKGVGAIRPLCCFFENVRNHLNCGYETVRSELQEMGYVVREGIYSAEEVGAPHRRERLFILAILADALRSGIGNQSRQITRGTWQEDVQQGDGEKRTIRTFTTSELGNSNDRSIIDPSGQHEINGEEEGIQERNENKESGKSCDVADSISAGLQGYAGNEQGEGRERTGTSGSITESSISLWPARPGEQQYDWEEPRIIEPSVGCTIDGYNFREDLLRMYGNGVVEQTAEIAFIDLLRKHGVIE